MIKILPHSTKIRVIRLASAATLGTAALIGLHRLQPHLSSTEKELIEQKEFMRNHAPEKFSKMMSTNASSIEWHKAVQTVKESLRNDSIAKANYLKAAQNIRKGLKK